MKDEKLIYQIALTLIPKIGAITARKLVEHIGSPEAVFREKPGLLRKIPGVGDYLAGQVSRRNYFVAAEKEIENMEKHRISSVYYQDPAYPQLLKNCEDGPLVLFYRGKARLNRQKLLSIVGTRSATGYGREVCEAIVAGLSARYPDLVIVSGLAYGIDVMAHRFALKYGLDTFAVLAHGLTTLYPSSHADVAGRILEQGALLTDFHSATKPEKNNFLRRNRIIAGLSEATLVVESGPVGGALITAELAASYNREVLAVPGRATDPHSAGCNNLIKVNIAALVEGSQDIEKLLGWETTVPDSDPQLVITTPLTKEEEQVLQTLDGESGTGPDIISIRSGIPMHRLMGLLLQMELSGKVSVMPGNSYKAGCVKQM